MENYFEVNEIIAQPEPKVDIDGLPWISFFGAIRHKWFEYCVNILQEYDIGYYIAAAEKETEHHKETDGEHLHFTVQMTERQYQTFAKRIFIDKFKLRGRAKDGCPRQYGKVKAIRDLEKMKAYTVKEGNILTNIPDEELKHLMEIAFKKDDKQGEERNFRDDMMVYIQMKLLKDGHDMSDDYKLTRYDVGVQIIAYIQEKNADYYPLTKSRLEGYVRHFLMFIRKWDPERIYRELYCN